MIATFEVSGDGGDDGAGSLRQWLLEDDDLGGRARMVPAPVKDGELGSLSDLLAVTLGPGGVATAVAAGAIAWIRRRVGDVALSVTRPDGASLSLKSRNIRGMDEVAVRNLVTQTAAWLDGAEPGPGSAADVD